VVEIAKLVRPSLVKITQVGRDGPYGVGSGFIFSQDGLIATNRHVIGEARRLKVETSDGKEHPITEIVATDPHLDLAILRVSTQGLPPLVLGDSDTTKQGAPVVAMGNPEGLTFSVVEGVVSEPQRDIEGIPMIQIAVPIERGNSGGPLLDRQGHVLGLLTLKSARTENLGFAMPVNALKKLLEHPNPVPMERWLTIGVLNPRFWQTRMGAQWSQRSGIISVTQPGDGFGGRSLCLWMNPPNPEFEATVTTWLEDESGAAGLTFCTDDQNRHYGFYPTGGKLRLTRFDGPDVFSWKILQDVATDAYHPGDWNRLRVKVTETHITCFVNEIKVIDLEETGLRGGSAGLCKFRNTSAHFKHFRIGNHLEQTPPSNESEVAVNKTINNLLGGQIEKDEALQDFAQIPEASSQLLTIRQRELEKQLRQLKSLSIDLHRKTVRTELAQELDRSNESANLLKCALLLSKHDNPDLDIASYEQGFALMVQELEGRPELQQGTAQALKLVCDYLFSESGFHGSRGDYANRSNSYINDVLDDREGLPISLALLTIELAQRLGIQNVVGIPLPNRFMVGYRDSKEDEYSLVDVFERGKTLTMEQAIALVSGSSSVPEKSKQPASKKEIILRMIRNLMSSQTESNSPATQSLPYLDLVIALDPETQSERLTRALLLEKIGDQKGAIQDVEWLLSHLPDDLSENLKETLERWLQRIQR